MVSLFAKGQCNLEDISVNTINVNGSFSIQNVDIYNKDIFVYSCTSNQIISQNQVLVWNQTNVGKSVDTNGFRASRSGNYMIILNLYLSEGSNDWTLIRYAINSTTSYYDIYSAYQNNSPDNLISTTFVVNLNANDLLTFVNTRTVQLKYTGPKSSFQGFFIGTS